MTSNNGGTMIGKTWSMLTEQQLAEAAHVLRSAALVVEHTGHTTGSLVDRDSGSVCQVGAIELATYKALHSEHKGQPWFHSNGYDDGGAYRAEHAIVILAEMVPLGLCDQCDPESKCICGCGDHSEQEPFSIVTHYNDNHAVTPALAVNMMLLAADRAERSALLKRIEVRAGALVDA